MLFVGAPTVLAWRQLPVPAMPTLWLFTLFCLMLLLADHDFDRTRFLGLGPWREVMPGLLLRVGLGAVLITVLVLAIDPALLFNFPRRRPLFWALIMVLYPLLSVYPQGIIYRAFVMHRYQPLVGQGAGAVMLSALAFSYLHVVLRNPVAMVLTLAGGLMFARTYQRTGSLMVSGLEHALYGDLIFTLGLGQYFFTGAIRA